MEDRVAADIRQRVLKWLEEGQSVGSLLDGLLGENEQLQTGATAADQEGERLRQENAHLRKEQEDLVGTFGKLLADMLHPMDELLQKIRGMQSHRVFDGEPSAERPQESPPSADPSQESPQRQSEVAPAERGAAARKRATGARIGFLSVRAGPSEIDEVFDRCLRELVKDQSFAMEYRWAERSTGRLRELAAELAGLPVDLLVADGTPAALMAKATTSTIPIVFAVGGHPVSTGLVSSLTHPDGNLTGAALMASQGGTKQLELLKEALPGVSRVVVLWNPAQPAHGTWLKEMEAVAPSLLVELPALGVRGPKEFEGVSAWLAKWRPGALLVLDDPLFVEHRRRIVDLTITQRVPTMFGAKVFVDAGGLMAYGPSLSDLFRRAAVYVDKILQGATPADLPVEKSTRFELVLNLRTAKALGLTLPESVLTRADQVIQ